MQTQLRFYPYVKDNPNILDRLPFGSARGCSQKLESITDPKLYRTIQGQYISFQQQGYEKYMSVLTCQDEYPAALNGLYTGQAITIECLVDLVTAQGKKGDTITLDRGAVTQSLRLFRPNGQKTALKDDLLQNQTLVLSDDGHVAYRPILHMIIQKIEQSFSEWENKTTWVIKSVEI